MWNFFANKKIYFKGSVESRRNQEKISKYYAGGDDTERNLKKNKLVDVLQFYLFLFYSWKRNIPHLPIDHVKLFHCSYIHAVKEPGKGRLRDKGFLIKDCCKHRINSKSSGAEQFFSTFYSGATMPDAHKKRCALSIYCKASLSSTFSI